MNRLKNYIFLILLPVLISLGCNKKSLDAENKSKVFLMQIDYENYVFEGGKEFSYFTGNTGLNELPSEYSYQFHNFNTADTGKLKVNYSNVEVFSGIQFWQGQGKKLFPTNIDDPVYYFKRDNALQMPDTTDFKLVYYDLEESVKYDSIWNAISTLDIVARYRSRNSQAPIGLFLFRPSVGTAFNPGDWKWFVLIRN